MDNKTLEKEREKTKAYLTSSSLDDKRKERFLGLIPEMTRTELAKLRLSLKRLMYLAASKEVVNEVVETKNVPEDEGGLIEMALAKVSDKVGEIEKRFKTAAAN